jgi:hypothetical protein
MRTGKRSQITSVSGAIRAANSAKIVLKPPRHVKLERTDKPFFHSILAEFARSEWSDHQLELAAILARAMADLEREQRELRIEGSVIETPAGKMTVNPRQNVVSNLSSTILSMRRSLSLQAHATKGDARDIAKRRNLTKEIEADTLVTDDLLGLD